MRREVPLTIVFVCGAFMAFQYFVPHHVSATIYQYALNWTIIIGIFTLTVGIGSLINLHYDRISKRKERWQYSIVTLVALAFMTILGLLSPNALQDPRSFFMTMYFYVLSPVQATMFALLATAPLGRRTRSYLQQTLWGSSCYDGGRQNLRRALSDLRSILGDDFDRFVKCTNSDVELDVSLGNCWGAPGSGAY